VVKKLLGSRVQSLLELLGTAVLWSGAIVDHGSP